MLHGRGAAPALRFDARASPSKKVMLDLEEKEVDEKS
jgi:hypothetical protein